MVKDPTTGEKEPVQVNVWNPTIANLTLMALGSSAPEILLSVIETVTTLTETPGELGPSTIVGSAAFNLMVISGVSIYAVTDKPKKINDMGVFSITCTSSLWAYIWLLIVLKFWTPDHVSLEEAILTVVFFILLLIAAYFADKHNEKKMKAAQTKEDQAKEFEKQKQMQAKEELIQLVEKGTYTKEYMLNVAFGAKKSEN